jgi:hypothetical protein
MRVDPSQTGRRNPEAQYLRTYGNGKILILWVGFGIPKMDFLIVDNSRNAFNVLQHHGGYLLVLYSGDRAPDSLYFSILPTPVKGLPHEK